MFDGSRWDPSEFGRKEQASEAEIRWGVLYGSLLVLQKVGSEYLEKESRLTGLSV